MAHFHAIFDSSSNAYILTGHGDLPETIIHFKIQNFSKIKNSEISRPVEYSIDMLLAEYSVDLTE